MQIELKNAYYFRRINKIGGIESHLNYIAKKYGNKYDITILYKVADSNQINRLRKMVRCIQVTNDMKIKCEVLFCCFNREILDQCESKKTYLVLHGDYKDMLERGQLDKTQLPLDKRIDEYLGVSQLVCDSWEQVSGLKAKNVYEPVELDKCEEPILLLSATRLTAEKGHGRMQKLAKILDDNRVNYIWHIYTDSEERYIDSPNIVYCQPRIDIANKMSLYTAFVQLSDNEGYCLSVIEALKRKIPILCTDLKVLQELNLDESNSIKVNLDMSNIDVEKIKQLPGMKKRMTTYKEPTDKWNEVFAKGKSTYKSELIKVRATNLYRKLNTSDAELGYIPCENEIFYVDKARFEVLNKHKLGRFVELC